MNKTHKSDGRELTLIKQFYEDAQTMAQEAGIHGCTFASTIALLAMSEIAANGHDHCLRALIGQFFTGYADFDGESQDG